jgi:hypothetical protein
MTKEDETVLSASQLTPNNYKSPVFRDLSKFVENHRSALLMSDKLDLGIFWMNKDLTEIIHFKSILHEFPDEETDLKKIKFASNKVEVWYWMKPLLKNIGNCENYPFGNIFYVNESFFVEINFNTSPKINSYLCEYFHLPICTTINKIRFDFSNFDWVTGEGDVFFYDIVTNERCNVLGKNNFNALDKINAFLSAWEEEKEKYRKLHPEIIHYDDNNLDIQLGNLTGKLSSYFSDIKYMFSHNALHFIVCERENFKELQDALNNLPFIICEKGGTLKLQDILNSLVQFEMDIHKLKSLAIDFYRKFSSIPIDNFSVAEIQRLINNMYNSSASIHGWLSDIEFVTKDVEGNLVEQANNGINSIISGIFEIYSNVNKIIILSGKSNDFEHFPLPTSVMECAKPI